MPCMRNALLRGYIAPPVLAPRIVAAQSQWLEWHHDFALNQLPGALTQDAALAAAADAMDNRAEVFTLNEKETALQVRLNPSLNSNQSESDDTLTCSQLQANP